MLYRILVDLDICKAGVISPLAGISLANIDKLVAAGCIAPLSAPPLVVFDGWDRRAARLEKQGIADALQLLEADTADLARKLRVKQAEIEQWKSEVKTWLIMPGY